MDPLNEQRRAIEEVQRVWRSGHPEVWNVNVSCLARRVIAQLCDLSLQYIDEIEKQRHGRPRRHDSPAAGGAGRQGPAAGHEGG
jgi:hypothetical protein